MHKAQYSSNSILKLIDISKSYPGVKALDKVSINMEKGKVHALLGENGAGKSTLIKIISGVIKPEEGTILINGKKVIFNNPRQAFNCGIDVVHQERNVVPTFTVGENIMLEKIADGTFAYINKEKIYQESQEFIETVGLEVSPT
ncbi:MAG: ATP-binding cassette domain-containing protein, partial [Perlabentimonas sp.]